MTTKTKLRVGQLGVGGFGATRRARIRQSGLFELVAAYDLNAEALKKCQAEDGAKPVSSYEELLATPGIEAVVISTGAKFHAEQMLRAMARGLHVFVEKPLCAAPAEIEALIAAQKKTGLVVGVGHADHSRKADSVTIRRLLDTGALGKIATFEFTTAHSGGLAIKPGDWRGDPEKNPGGMLFQCGVHAVHELLFYFGPITEVFSMMRYDVHTTLTADVAICHLKFASGLIGSLNAYHVTPYRHALNIFGTEMNLYREELYFDEGTKLWRQRRGSNMRKEAKELVTMEETTDECGNLRSFYRVIREGGTPYPSLLDGARAVQVVFAAEESAKAGRPVPVAEL